MRLQRMRLSYRVFQHFVGESSLKNPHVSECDEIADESATDVFGGGKRTVKNLLVIETPGNGGCSGRELSRHLSSQWPDWCGQDSARNGAD